MNRFTPRLTLVIIFFLIISLPMILITFNLGTDNSDGIRKSEQREIKTFKKSVSSLRSFRSRFEEAFSDHFPGRNHIYMLASAYKMKILNTSFAPRIGVVGQDGWLFLGDHWGGELKHFLSRDSSIAAEAESWASSFSLFQNEISKQKTLFRYVVAPNKSTIYFEKLPKWYQAYEKKTWLSEVSSNPRSNSFLVDLRPALMSLKNSVPLYHKADSHWNRYGAFVAYLNIMESLRTEDINIKSIDADVSSFLQQENNGSYDISNMFFIEQYKDIVFEPARDLFPWKTSSAKLGEFKECSMTPTYIENPNALNNNSVLIFCDSFGSTPAPYLVESFKEITFVHSDIINSKELGLLALLKNNKFDILLIETVERKILPVVYGIAKPLEIANQ